MKYYALVFNDKIIGKCESDLGIEEKNGYKALEKQTYEKILNTPCSYVKDEQGNIIDVETIMFPDILPRITETEILWQTITDLQLDLIVTNQFLTDAQIEIESLKGGIS